MDKFIMDDFTRELLKVAFSKMTPQQEWEHVVDHANLMKEVDNFFIGVYDDYEWDELTPWIQYFVVKMLELAPYLPG